MIIDRKSDANSSTSEHKLSIELPFPRQIYTVGSTVTGIIHLGSKELERIQEIQVSLVCVVRSLHHRYIGGSTYDIRRETTKLIHRDQTLWSHSGGASIPPTDLPFQITIPEVGNDRRANDPNTPLPPSFHAGKRRGWRNWATYGSSIGFIKYHVKVSLIRKGTLTRKERAFCPFIFLSSSPPPPLLPQMPEITLGHTLSLSEDIWCPHATSTNLRHPIFSPNGHASFVLWIPRVSGYPRLTPIPFVLCLSLQTRQIEGAPLGEVPEDILPPDPQIKKASIFLQQTIWSCARGGKQKHTNTFDAAPTDNILYGVIHEEGGWSIKRTYQSQREMTYWEKQFIWRGLWTFRETPSFVNRQLSWEYALVAEVPIKGFGNGTKLVSDTIKVSSGVTAGTSISVGSEDDMFDLPPDYFENDGTMNDDEEEDRDEKT